MGVRPLTSSVRPTARILLVGPGGALRVGAGEREESGERGDLGGARAHTPARWWGPRGQEVARAAGREGRAPACRI